MKLILSIYETDTGKRKVKSYAGIMSKDQAIGYLVETAQALKGNEPVEDVDEWLNDFLDGFKK
jgi:hypothetical protein